MSTARQAVKDPGTAFRTNLAAQRELRQLTQSELGRRAGLAPAAISHFETGQRAPSLESLVRLADALDCSIDLLLGRENTHAASRVDPVFLRASNADAKTLDTLKRVTAALLQESKN